MGADMTKPVQALRVLYLEDNPVDADLTRRELARMAPEMRLEVVTNLGAALERLASERPLYDVVLADLNLPDGSGLDLLAHVRERELPLAFVIVTGAGDQELAVVAVKSGADDYLVKRADNLCTLPRVLSAAYLSFQKSCERRARPLRVLYCEPNSFDLDLTRRFLAQHAPYIHLEVVGSGEEVLACLPRAAGGGTPPPELLLLDYRLPGLDALEVVKILRLERGLDLPIVLVTGQGTEEVAVRALRLGVDDYLVKHNGYLHRLPAVLEKVQKQTELHLSEERYRSLFENNHAVMLVIDPTTGEIVDANPAAAAWYGWPREVLCGKALSEISTLPWNELLEEIEQARLRNDWHFQCHHRRADGSVRDIEAFSGPVTVAGRSLLHVIIQDVTDKVLAERELKRSEAEFCRLSQEFNGLLDAIPDSLMLLDRELKVLWVNRVAADNIGAAAEGLAGRHCYSLWCGRDSPCESCPVLLCFESGSPQDVTVTKPDGRTWEIRAVPLLDGEGTVANVIELKRDISAHRKLEMMYLHAQKMESIGTLAGGVAHDFNNILTVILGLGQVTLMKMAHDDPQRRNIAGILEAGERATQLTKELLLFSRRQDSQRHPVDLNEVIGNLEKFLRRIIGEEIALKQSLHEGILPILADGNHLGQVLMNLAVNARDAMPKGGGLIIQTEQAFLDGEFVAAHGYGKPGAFALLTVSDTGTGMDEQTQQRIFEPFFSTKEVGKGTGLGLSVVYGIVQQHEGFINVYSEPGHGTTFRIYFPLLSEPARQETLHEQDTPMVGGAEAILLAEDNDLVRTLMTSVLAEAGYRVIVATDGEDAVRKFRENADAVQLLIFDLIMPRMNGKEASDEIHRTHPGIKTLFASGYAPEMIREKASLGEGRDLVYKPISPKELLKKVRSVLDGGRS
jgi:two-component system, cell cycle sensor histidine kinase and response regulator CckA